jgi:hypothetical protein
MTCPQPIHDAPQIRAFSGLAHSRKLWCGRAAKASATRTLASQRPAETLEILLVQGFLFEREQLGSHFLFLAGVPSAADRR